MSTKQRAPLTRERILEAAIEIVDRDGAAGLSMRKLGAALGVEAMSLYNHVANKQDVLDGMTGLLISRMTDFPVLHGSWRDVIVQVCRAYRSVGKAHPNVFALSAGRPLVSGEDHDAFHTTLGTLIAAGFPEDIALDMFHCGASYVRGFIVGELAYGTHATLVDFVWDDDRAFERGLAAMLDGFAAMRDAEA